MITDKAHLETIDTIYTYSEPAYLVITGRVGDSDEMINRYLPDNNILVRYYEDAPVWIAVIVADNAHFLVDRFASGLIHATRHQSRQEALEAAIKAVWEVRR